MRLQFLSILILPVWLCAANYALLAGSGNGGGDVVPLRYVKSDLAGMKQVLTDHCRYLPERITILKDGTPEDLAAQFRLLKKKMTAEDQLFFYYTGHADHKSLRMGKQRYDLTALKAALDSLPGTLQIVVLDACQSGSFSRLKGGTIDEPLKLRSEPTGTGRVVLFSSSESEFSQESDYLKHSVFSFYFMNGLRGMADLSGDRKVTLDEAYKYAYGQTVGATLNSSGGIQHPGFIFDYHGKGDIILSDMTSRKTGVQLDRSVNGQVVIIDAARQIAADFTADGTRPVLIALNPGKYVLYRNRSGKSSKKNISVTDKMITVASESFTAVRSIPVVKKGGSVPVLFGLAFAGGAASANHFQIQKSISTKMPLPKGTAFTTALPETAFRMGAGGTLLFSKGVISSVQLSAVRFFGEQIDNGTVTGPLSDRYPTQLVHNELLKWYELRLLGGYRWTPFKRQGISVLAGASLNRASLSSEQIYNESLFGSANTLSLDEKDRTFLLNGAVLWDFSLSPSFSLNASALYSAAPAGSRENHNGFSSDPSGVRIELGGTFFLNGE